MRARDRPEDRDQHAESRPSAGCLSTASLMSASGMRLLFPGAENLFGADRLVPRAALGEQKPDDLLERQRVGGAAKERALAPHRHEAFVLQLVEVVGERRRGDSQF